MTVKTFTNISSPLGILRFRTTGIKSPLISFVFGSSAKITDGIPITNSSKMNKFFGENGYCDKVTMENKERSIVNKVFIKNSVEDCWTLFITCLPSFTTEGSDENLESSKTRLLSPLATSLPSAIAMEQSASFSAKVSFTPSPVIATTLPSFFSDFTKISFCSGLTRPKTVNIFAYCSTCWLETPSSETKLSAPKTPTLCAILLTVTGLSPEIILTCTLFCLNHSIVSKASSLMWSRMEISISGSQFFGACSLSSSIVLLYASIKTLSPFDVCLYIISLILLSFLWLINSGAPKTKVPILKNDVIVHFLFEEKSTLYEHSSSLFVPYFLTSAVFVEFDAFWLYKMFAIICSFCKFFTLFSSITSQTCIVPSVIVPVLSRHKTLLLASISMEKRSFTSVFFLLSLITPTASAIVTSKNIPAGTIPVNAPQVFITA